MKTSDEHMEDSFESLRLAIVSLVADELNKQNLVARKPDIHNQLMPRLFSISEAAGLLGVGKTFMYSLVNSGTIRVIELGTGRMKQRIRADDLQRFIDERSFGG